MSSQRRRERIAEVREEARLAFEVGNSRNPYDRRLTSDHDQWQNAYDALAARATYQAKFDAEQWVQRAIDDVRDEDTRIALDRLFEFVKELRA